MSRRVGYVPLPEVAERSEVITVGELGLPVGFDIEQLELHVARTERIARFCDFGTLAVRGYSGETTEYSYGISGMSKDGTGFLTKAGLQQKAPLYGGNASFSSNPETDIPRRYQWSHGDVKINNAEIEERIKNDGDKWDRGVFDAAARAKYMDKALRKGIVGVASDARFPNGLTPSLLDSMAHHGTGTLINTYVFKYLGGFSTELALASYTVLRGMDPVLMPLADRLTVKSPKPKIQRTICNRMHYDRLIIASGLSKASRLVRARA